MGFKEIPEEGLKEEEVFKIMEEYRKEDVDYKGGKVWSLVYYKDDEHIEFLKKAHGKFFSENALNPLAFKSLLRFERETVQMASSLFHGDENVVGVLTAGGTESIILAVKTYRDYGREKRGIKKPNMVLPESAHVAFLKGAEFLCIEPRFVPLNRDYVVDINKVEKYIDKNTIMLVGSAPSYPFGVVDPIEKLGEIAVRHKIPLHVDGCLGGFFLPFLEMLGYDIPAFDFRVNGVTSISADVHKYAYGAKGASLILYRNMKYMRYQFTVFESWVGGVYVSPVILGTRPGGPIASAWATLVKIGKKGYMENARLIMSATERLKKGIESIEELEILGKPHMSVFAYASKDRRVNIYAVADLMEKKGWHVDRIQKPMGIHVMVNPVHDRIIDKYIRDLKESVEYVKEHPELATEGNAAMYGITAKIPLRGLVKKNVLKIVEGLYLSEGGKSLEDEDMDEDFSMKAGKVFLKIYDKWEAIKEKLSLKK